MAEKSQNNKTSPAKGTAKPRKRDRSASEERLVKAGLEIFSKHGFNGATTRMIAQKASVNESLIGRYFDGKEGLLIAIVKSFVDEVHSRDLPYPPQNTLDAELKMYIQDRVKMGCTHTDVAHIIISQALVDKKFKRRARETITLMVDPHLISRVSLLAEKGQIKKEDVEQICEEFDTYMDGLFFFDGIMYEEDPAVMIQKAERFASNYARLYKSK